MFVAKLVTRIPNVNPKMNTKYIAVSIMHKHYTSMVGALGTFWKLGHSVSTQALRERHSLEGRCRNQTGHLKAPKAIMTDSEIMFSLCKHDC